VWRTCSSVMSSAERGMVPTRFSGVKKAICQAAYRGSHTAISLTLVHSPYQHRSMG
jgi:hypothetical protein